MGLHLSRRSEPMSLALLMTDASLINAAACATNLLWGSLLVEKAGVEIMLFLSHGDTYLFTQTAPGIKAPFSGPESLENKDAFLMQDLLC